MASQDGDKTARLTDKRDTAVLEVIRDRLNALFNVQRIVLFGSRSRGDAKSDSDYDVLVIAQSELPFIKRQGIALLALGKRDFSVDLLMYTPAEAEDASKKIGSAVYWAEREGKELLA